MNTIEALRATLEQASLTSLGVGFLLGFIFTFNPVALAAIPVSLAYVTKAHAPKTATLYGGMFVLGMVITQTLLGLIAGLGGHWVAKLIDREWGLLLGPVLILLGLMWPGWIRLPLPSIAIRAKRVSNGWGAFALGVPFLLRFVQCAHPLSWCCSASLPGLARRCSAEPFCLRSLWGEQSPSSWEPWPWVGWRVFPYFSVTRRHSR